MTTKTKNVDDDAVTQPSPAILLGDNGTMTFSVTDLDNPTENIATTGGVNTDDSTTVTKVVVHPLVVMHVLDHHTRRQENKSRIIGTLLGTRIGDDGRTVEVTNSFAVPHAERGDEVAIGKDFNKTMLSLHLRTNRKETVVGWYATTAASDPSDTNNSNSDQQQAVSLIPDTSSLIHEFYAAETDDNDPIHLVVDTSLKRGDNLPIRAFRNTPVVIQGEQLGNLFHELKLEIKSNEPETICLYEMIHNPNLFGEVGGMEDEKNDQNKDEQQQDEQQEPSVDELQLSMEKLYGLLDSTLSYVDTVVDNKSAAAGASSNSNNSSEIVGRRIADTLSAVPHMRREIFDKLFHDSLQDLLMVTYLSNLTRAQITIAEKLNASLGV